MKKQTEKPFDVCTFCMAFEAGELSDDEVIAGFQHLIDTGLCWALQGFYGRTAAQLIRLGACHHA